MSMSLGTSRKIQVDVAGDEQEYDKQEDVEYTEEKSRDEGGCATTSGN
jgi:hypothetical protein